MVDTKKFYRWLAGIFGGGVVLASAVFLGVIPAVQNADKPAYLDILVLPEGAQVEIDGQEYRNAVYEMEPGAYTATVKLGDLAPEVVKFTLEKNRTMGLYMYWSADEGWQYYTAEELAHKNTLGEIMPLYLSICGAPASRVNCNAIEVRHDRSPECGNEECVVISGRDSELTDEVLGLVRGELSKNGYNLDNYQYVYVQNANR